MPELTRPDFDSFVCFNLETSGTFGAANGDAPAEITEIGAVRVVKGEITETSSQLVNPGRKIVPRIARITYITDEMVADQPGEEEAVRRFADFVGNNILVGHNRQSDLHYINAAARRAGVWLENPFFDTYHFARTLKEAQGWENVKLEYLSEVLGHRPAGRPPGLVRRPGQRAALRQAPGAGPVKKNGPGRNMRPGPLAKTLLEGSPVQIQFLAAAVVNVRTVSGEEGAGKAQSQVHAHLLQHDGGLVPLKGVALKPAVREVGFRIVDVKAHAVVREDALVRVDPRVLRTGNGSIPPGEAAVRQVKAGQGGRRFPLRLP